MRRQTNLWIVTLVCFVTLFAGLGSTALWDPDEPRFAEATRQMFERHDFLTPWFNAAPRFEKPILFYWMQAPFFLALGPTETAARLPSAIAGLLTVLFCYSLAARITSPRAGLFAALALATTFRFVLYARQGLTDVPVTAFVTMALWCFHGAANGPPERSRRIAWLGWVAVGCAALTKGPVAIVPVLIWLMFLLATGTRETWRRWHVVSGSALALVVALPWFVAMAAIHGRAFLEVALGYEVVARYVSADFPGRERGPLFFATVFLGDGAPWSFFFVAALLWALVRRPELDAGTREVVILSSIWVGTVLLIFSISRYKLPHYIMPAYPGMALLVGTFTDAAIRDAVRPRALWNAPLWISSGALLILAVLLWLLLERAFGLPHTDRAFIMPIVLAAGSVLTAFWHARGNRTRAATALIATLTAVLGYLALVIAPRELRRFQPVPVLARSLRQIAGDQEPIAVAGNYGAPGLVFYTRRPVVQLKDREELIAYLSAPGPRHCVLPRSDFDQIESILPPGYEITGDAEIFSVRMRRLLERVPERASRQLVIISSRPR